MSLLYVHLKQMTNDSVHGLQVTQLFSAKTSPTTRRSHPTYCTLQLPFSLQCSTKRSGGLGQPFSGNGPKMSGSPVTITPSLSRQITLDCLRALCKIDYIPCSTDKNAFGIGSLRCVDLVPYIFCMLLYS